MTEEHLLGSVEDLEERLKEAQARDIRNDWITWGSLSRHSKPDCISCDNDATQQAQLGGAHGWAEIRCCANVECMKHAAILCIVNYDTILNDTHGLDQKAQVLIRFGFSAEHAAEELVHGDLNVIEKIIVLKRAFDLTYTEAQLLIEVPYHALKKTP